VFPILARKGLAPGLTRLIVSAPLVARRRQAGQFVIVRAEEGGERIPLTIVEACEDSGSITLIVQAVGKSTRLIASKLPGDTLLDVVGPLGNPTPLVADAVVACVGGGVGAAELWPIARALRAAGNTLHTVLGARSGDLVILERELATISATLTVTTDDGSLGRPGQVTDALSERLAQSPALEAVYAVGPLPMMKAVAELTRPLGVRTFVSVNALMVDGTGMCGGCRVTVGGRMRFACVDGPEFDGHDVDFDELIRRNRTYRRQERQADETPPGEPSAPRTCVHVQPEHA
jgi:ferredoxin/flavodoxin---NADP+ reductase